MNEITEDTAGSVLAGAVRVTDGKDPALSLYRDLTEAQLRRRVEGEHGVFIAESPTVIGVALDAGCRPVSLLCDDSCLNRDVLAVLSRCRDVPTYLAAHDVMTALTGFPLTRGALCAMERPVPNTAEAVTRGARRVAVLENVTDTTNIGAIFRSAAALGLDAVLLTPSCCDPLCRRAVRVSMGTVFCVPFARIGASPEDWAQNGQALLSGLGFRTAAMALRDDNVPIDDPRLKAEPRLAILLGTEGDGLAPSTIARSDYTVKIPMAHGVDSLNVAAAAALAFWELRAR